MGGGGGRLLLLYKASRRSFGSQETEGKALLLLKGHLMRALNIKLGPALKICTKINVLKET